MPNRLPIHSAYLPRGQLQMNENEDHPLPVAFEALGTFGAGENPTDRQLGSELRFLLPLERMSSPITAAALTQPSGAPVGATDRTSNHG